MSDSLTTAAPTPSTGYWINQFGSSADVPPDFSPIASGATLPGYVSAYQKSLDPSAGSPGTLGTFTLNGQTNYGYLKPGTSGWSGSGDASSFMTTPDQFSPISVPLTSSEANTPGYSIPTALYGQTVAGLPGSAPAYTFNNGVASLTPNEQQLSTNIQEQQYKDETNLLPYLGLAFPLAAGGIVGLGALGALGPEFAGQIAGYAGTAAGDLGVAAGDLGPLAASDALGVGGDFGGLAGGADLASLGSGAGFGAGLPDLGIAGAGDLGGFASGVVPADVGLFGSDVAPIAADAGGWAADLGSAASSVTPLSGGLGDLGGFASGVIPGGGDLTFGGALAPAAGGFGDFGGPITGGFADVVGSPIATGASSGGGILGEIGSALGIGPQTSTLGMIGKIGGLASSALSLGKDLLGGNRLTGNQQLRDLAGNALSQSATLQSYLTTGTLPPAVQSAVDAATRDGVLGIKANYARRGIAPGSSMEQQDIARLKQNAVIQGATLADQLYAQGMSETQIAAGIYQNLQSTDLNLQTQTGNAIANLAHALAGGGGQNYKLVPA